MQALSFQSDKPLKELSTFRIGGPARFFTTVSTIPEMQAVLRRCRDESIPFFIVGKGSNCLFGDAGFDGLVIQNKISYFKLEGNVVDVGAGYSFSLLGRKTARLGLAGLEFSSGIPASVGGAVFMNAGASGSETWKPLVEVCFVDETGELLRFSKGDLSYGYRYSSFHEKKGAVVSAKFSLEPKPEARDRQLAILAHRKKTQPYDKPSVGCVFKNPPGTSAGLLIEKAGLKGLKRGGAEVSSLHANFIVNAGGAKSDDVLRLAAEVRRIVLESTGIELEMEIRCIS